MNRYDKRAVASIGATVGRAYIEQHESVSEFADPAAYFATGAVANKTVDALSRTMVTEFESEDEDSPLRAYSTPSCAVYDMCRGHEGESCVLEVTPDGTIVSVKLQGRKILLHVPDTASTARLAAAAAVVLLVFLASFVACLAS